MIDPYGQYQIDPYDPYNRYPQTGGFTGYQPPAQPNTAPGANTMNAGGTAPAAGTDLGNGNFQPGITGAPGNQQSTQQSQGAWGQYRPEGYNFSSDSNSTKYQVGRILSQYPPGPEGLQQAASQLAALGIRVTGRDTITLPDGTTADVGRAFSNTDPGASRAWQYNWSGPGGNSPTQSTNPMAGYQQNTQTRAQMNQPLPTGITGTGGMTPGQVQTQSNPFAGWLAQAQGNTGITGGMVRPQNQNTGLNPGMQTQDNPFQTSNPQINPQPTTGGLQNDQQNRMRNMGFSGFRVS